MTGIVEVQVRDPSGLPSGPLRTWTSLTAIARLNAVGSIQVTFAGDDPAVGSLAAGAGLIVTYRPAGGSRVQFLAGPVDQPRWQVDPQSGMPYPGTRTVSCPCDMTVLADRGVFVNPGAAWSAQSSTAGVLLSLSGTASAIVRSLVTNNCSSSAPLTYRRTPIGVTTDAGLGRTSTQTFAQGDNILTRAQSILAPDGLAMHIVQTAAGPRFSVWAPVDRSAQVVFAYERGNVEAWDVAQGCSSGNYSYVIGGQSSNGSGGKTAALYASASSSSSIAAWRLVEQFSDRSGTTDTGQLADAAAQALAQSPDTAQMQIRPVDTAQATYGVHYGLGDQVAVRIAGQTVVQTVTEVKVTASTSGVVVEPTLGPVGSRPPSVPAVLGRVAALAQQINALSRRVV